MGAGDMLYFPEPPTIQALNCMPTFESSPAVVTVEPKTGVVKHYRILDDPLREDVAWSDHYLLPFRNSLLGIGPILLGRTFDHILQPSLPLL